MLYHSLVDWFAFTTFPLHMRKPVGPWTLLKAQWAKATLMVIGTCKQIAEHEIVNNLHLQALLLQVSTRIAGVSPKQTWTSICLSFYPVDWIRNKMSLEDDIFVTNNTVCYKPPNEIQQLSMQLLPLHLAAITDQRYVKESRTQLSKIQHSSSVPVKSAKYPDEAHYLLLPWLRSSLFSCSEHDGWTQFLFKRKPAE